MQGGREVLFECFHGLAEDSRVWVNPGDWRKQELRGRSRALTGEAYAPVDTSLLWALSA